MPKYFPIYALVALAGLVQGTEIHAAFLPVCERTAPIKDFLVLNLKKSCETISESDLVPVKRIAVGHRNIKEFKVDDFSGLPNLEIVNIRSNPYTLLPEGLFKNNPRLKTIVIIDADLRHYPDDFLEHNPEIENLHIFGAQVRSISESILRRLENAKHLKVMDFDEALQPAEKERLQKLFPVGGKIELNFI